MITQTRDSHQIPSQNFFEILQETLNATHLLKLLDKMYKYEMDPTRTVDTTGRTRNAGRTDRWSETNISPQQLCCAGGIMNKA